MMLCYLYIPKVVVSSTSIANHLQKLYFHHPLHGLHSVAFEIFLPIVGMLFEMLSYMFKNVAFCNVQHTRSNGYNQYNLVAFVVPTQPTVEWAMCLSNFVYIFVSIQRRTGSNHIDETMWCVGYVGAFYELFLQFFSLLVRVGYTNDCKHPFRFLPVWNSTECTVYVSNRGRAVPFAILKIALCNQCVCILFQWCTNFVCQFGKKISKLVAVCGQCVAR